MWQVRCSSAAGVSQPTGERPWEVGRASAHQCMRMQRFGASSSQKTRRPPTHWATIYQAILSLWQRKVMQWMRCGHVNYTRNYTRPHRGYDSATAGRVGNSNCFVC